MGLDKVPVNAERGRALGGVERAEPSTRARAEIVEAASGPEPGVDGVDRRCDRAEVFRDRRHGAPVLRVHELEQLDGLEPVELAGPRVLLLAHRLITSAAATPQTRAAPMVAI